MAEVGRLYELKGGAKRGNESRRSRKEGRDRRGIKREVRKWEKVKAGKAAAKRR